MSSYVDGPETTDSEFDDVFDAYFDEYSTRNSELLKKIDDLETRLGCQRVENRELIVALDMQRNCSNRLHEQLRVQQGQHENAKAHHEAVLARYDRRVDAQEASIAKKTDEVERLVLDLYKARRNLPIKRGYNEQSHNVVLHDMEEEIMMANLSRRSVTSSYIDVQGDGRATLTLLMSDDTHISGVMRTSDGRPFSFIRDCEDNVWKGDHEGLSIGFGHLTMTNTCGRIPLLPRFSAMLERSLDRTRSIRFINFDDTERIATIMQESRRIFMRT
ncbi:unnamed protein product [Cylicocyclus nassatus]|uniref:Uncharacterized protein n=2 Tax=Cylicocyclus nassatus TaxID=53992 RepID=A0AA36H523_CYLNA|nr:unnamed protein product [Cylicocyclus nassatus]CAJ0609554.1 unnamed protein product [Cylicocyclus nassatus]